MIDLDVRFSRVNRFNDMRAMHLVKRAIYLIVRSNSNQLRTPPHRKRHISRTFMSRCKGLEVPGCVSLAVQLTTQP